MARWHKVEALNSLLLMFKALRAVYPEYNWKLKERIKKPVSKWNDKNNQRLFFEQLASTLNVSIEDLYTVGMKPVLEKGGDFVLSHYKGSLPKGNILSYFRSYISIECSLSSQSIRSARKDEVWVLHF
jgi:hypothetical protein